MRTHITENEKSITHNTNKYTRESLSLNPQSLYYHTSGNMFSITKRISSQAILQSNNIAHRQSKALTTFSSTLQASYFLAQLFLGSNASTCVNSHLTLLTWLRNNCTNLKEIIPFVWMSFLYRKNPPTDSTLSLPLISTGSLTKLTCMSYL